MSDQDLFSFHHIQSCTSTNDEVKKIAHLNPETNCVLLSDEQTEGRGQRGKKWESEKNRGWFFSIHMPNTSIHISKSHIINWQVCLAVTHFLRSIGINQPLVKWPNDIYTPNGKIAGILVETQLKGNQLSSLTIGVGINTAPVSAKNTLIGTSSISAEITANSSILKEKERYVSNMVSSIIKSISNPLVNLKVLHAELIKYSFGINRYFNFDINDNIVPGQILDIDENGMLNLLIDNKITKFASGSLKWINEV